MFFFRHEYSCYWQTFDLSVSGLLITPVLPSGSSSLLPAVRFRTSRLCWQAHRHGDDEIHPGDAAVPVLCVSSRRPDPGRPPSDQQPLPAACGASAGGRATQHDIPTPPERKLADTLRRTHWIYTFKLYIWYLLYFIYYHYCTKLRFILWYIYIKKTYWPIMHYVKSKLEMLMIKYM